MMWPYGCSPLVSVPMADSITNQSPDQFSTAYNLVIIGGTAGALSVAISSQQAGLGLVRVISEEAVAFPALVAEEQLDVGYGESVLSIDTAGDLLVVNTNRLAYRTRAVMVAGRYDIGPWNPPMPTPPFPSDQLHVGAGPDDVEGKDVLVIGNTDHAVESVVQMVAKGANVVLAAGGMDPSKLSPAAEQMMRQVEKRREATMLYRAIPDSIGLIDGYPMAFFNDRRTPDLQFDHVLFGPNRRTPEPSELNISDAALSSGHIWFQTKDGDAVEGLNTAPGWRIGEDIAKACFPELELPEPLTPANRRRQLTSAIEEMREDHYNATITEFEPTHSDLWVLRVEPDMGSASHKPGQYASLGLGYWEARIDDAEDPNLDQKWEKLIRRSYSISSRMFDEHGYLADDTQGTELEFYIVLVPPTPDNIPGLTPRLALKRPGDRIYLGPKVAGRYTLAPVVNPDATVLFLSTGTGEAPQNSMVVELLRKGHAGPIVSAVSVRQWADLGYIDKHRALEKRYSNYQYLPMPTREADVPKRYIQDLISGGVLESEFGITLDPEHTHVFLCGNPAMIGLPESNPETGEKEFPEVTGVVELLTAKGFALDSRQQPGNIHYEEYW